MGKRFTKSIPTEINGSATITRKELIERWNLPQNSTHGDFFLRLERAGCLVPHKPTGARRGKIAYRVADVIEYEQHKSMIIRRAYIAKIANHIRTIARPSCDEWLGLWYAMWGVLSRLSPVERRACLEHIADSFRNNNQ